jgi:hypothetical protein
MVEATRVRKRRCKLAHEQGAAVFNRRALAKRLSMRLLLVTTCAFFAFESRASLPGRLRGAAAFDLTVVITDEELP